jgi:glycosyltransferase involved in cell wall biosynthesis
MIKFAVRAVGRLARDSQRWLDLRIMVTKQRRAFRGDTVAVAGFFGTNTGLSRAARLIALSLEKAGSRVIRVDLAPLFSRDPIVNHGFASAAECMRSDCSDLVYVANPHCDILSAFRASWLVERCVVGHWIWELERVPEAWLEQLHLYDEIWAPTDLVRAAIGPAAVRTFAYAPENDPFTRPTGEQRKRMRSTLLVDESTFVVGYSFSALSNYYRKNPEDAVKAFRIAFPAEKNVALLIRCPDIDMCPNECQLLERQIGSDDRIRILRKDGIAQFYAAIDLYLSTSRAEGYGLNLIEAAQCGIPVITTGWRVPPDIAGLPRVELASFALIDVVDEQGHYSGATRARWASPDLGDVAERLRTHRRAFLAR